MPPPEAPATSVRAFSAFSRAQTVAQAGRRSINGLASVLDSRSTVTAIAIAPDNRSTLYVATSGRGVYKSLDGGANWEPLNEGLTNLDVRLLAVASNALYAVTSSGIFKATD